MKIAIIAHSQHPIIEPFAGGLEMVTFLLCDSLIALGHEIHLYAHEDSDERFNVIPIISTEACLKDYMSATACSKHLTVDNLSEVIGYTKVMMKISTGDYDVVHNHSLHYIPIILGNSLQIPMITSIHTPQFDFLKIGIKELGGCLNQTFTMVSKSLAKTWENLIPRSEVVYNGIDLVKWKFEPNPSGDYLMWYGRICPEKGTALAINAAIESGHKIILAGPISNLEYFDEHVAPLLVSPNVDYVGHIPQNEIAPLLQNAIVFLFTSIWEEPYGLTLAESLACGTPVVALKGGATNEILTEASGVIVPTQSTANMVSAIRIAKKLNREDCRRRAEKFCTHLQMVDDYLALYDSLMEYRDYKLRKIS